jgi:hypothetical protein
MLVVMTFNIGLICGVIGGYVLATLLMGHLMSPQPRKKRQQPLSSQRSLSRSVAL